MRSIFPYDGLRDMLMLLRKMGLRVGSPEFITGHEFIARLARMYGRKL